MRLNMDILNAIDTAIKSEKNKEKPRDYFGLSACGNDCDRYIYLSYHQPERDFSARMHRIFRRGHHEENFVYEDLKRAGFHVYDTQRQIKITDKVKGHIDGIIDIDGEPHLLEIKTHQQKYFNQVRKAGIKSMPKHYAQMQAYMYGCDLEKGLYYAVCKNDDSIHAEFVDLDPIFAAGAIAKMKEISKLTEPPPKLTENPTWYKCKICPYWSACHGS